MKSGSGKPVSFVKRLEYAFAPVAQLDRASDYGSEGRGFESSRARHRKPAYMQHAQASLFLSAFHLFSIPNSPSSLNASTAGATGLTQRMPIPERRHVGSVDAACTLSDNSNPGMPAEDAGAW